MNELGRDGSLLEALVAAAAGATLAQRVGRRIGLDRGSQAAVAAIAGVNGFLGGRRATYDWLEPEGLTAYVLDSTWSITNTAAGLAVHAAQFVHGGADYRPELSRRRNRHVYAGGFAIRKGFVFTQGNVISAAAGNDDHDLTTDEPRAMRRRLLVERHEELHIWQARWFGPFYGPIYVGWMALGAIRGSLRWLRRRDRSLWEHVEVASYYENPFERWAYAADHSWPTAAVRRVRSTA